VNADQQPGAADAPQEDEKVITIMIGIPEGLTAQVRVTSADDPPESPRQGDTAEEATPIGRYRRGRVSGWSQGYPPNHVKPAR
jgi:hypothetical protein